MQLCLCINIELSNLFIIISSEEYNIDKILKLLLVNFILFHKLLITKFSKNLVL